MAKLTEAKLKSISPPTSGRKAYSDGGGLQLRVTANNHRSWSLQYNFGNQKKKVTLGSYPEISLKQARLLAAKRKLEIANGVDPNAVKAEERRKEASKTTVETIFDIYFKLHCSQLRPRTLEEYKRAYEHDIRPALGHLEIRELKRENIVQLIDRVATRAPTLANRLLTHINSFCRWCIGRGYLEHNPALAVPKPLKENAREHVMSVEEVRAVFAAAEETLSEDHKHALQFLILSSLRRSEVFNLKWSEVFSDRLRIGAERSKNKQQFDTPLTEALREILNQRPVSGEYVFSTTEGLKPIDINSKMKNRLTNRSEVHGWTIHDFRRAATTFMEDNGVPRFVTERVLNHKDGSVTGIYARSDYFEAKRKSLEMWQNAITDPTSTDKVIPLAFARGMK